MAFILTVAILHIFHNIALPVSWAGSRSYIVWSGVQDAMMQWWYGPKAVAFFLTAGSGDALLLPAQAGRAADTFLPPVDPVLLGHCVLLRLGGLAPPALHRSAALGADAG